MTSSDKERNAAELRRRAEEELARREGSAPHLQMDAQRLLHELHLHQIELELENESLRQMQKEMLEALRQLADIAEDQLRTHYPGARVLLVEAEPASREATKALLDAVGFKVDAAESGTQAIELAQRNDYDLILLDMQMPEMSGEDTARAVRAIPGRATVPILAMTATTSEEYRQRCRAAGISEHIAKPVAQRRLYGVLLHWLAHR